jgi:radical SAM protein with 4Fe4S-binding SPASM domain
MPIPPRVPLIEHLPLAAPFSVHIFSSYYCNFSCNYCIHGLNKAQQQKAHFQKQSMSIEIFQKAIDGISGFATRPKAIIFAGHGEPLTNPVLAEMVRYAKEKDVVERVEIVTNGSLLTPVLSAQLIAAGLDRLRVSLQGLNADDYKRVCGIPVDFSALMSNLAYFYKNKGNTDVFVKIIDIAMGNDGSEEQFHELFDSICDTAAIEYLFPFIDQIDHKTLGGALANTKHGDASARRVDICAMPFYMQVVLPNGDVTGCCAIQPPAVFGNVNETPLAKIWNSDAHICFLRAQIAGRKASHVCSGCTVPDYGMQQGDHLDIYKENLEQMYATRMCGV